MDEVITPSLGTKPPVYFGFDEIPEIAKLIRGNGEFIFVDHAYMGRGYDGDWNFRVIKSGIHQTKLKPVEKAKTFAYKPREWRKSGSHILVFPPSYTMGKTIPGSLTWMEQTLATLVRNTDRKIVIKQKQMGPLEGFLKDCHAVVGYGTVASVEAALAGIPVFSGPHCPATPIGLTDFSLIESPIYPDREPWFNSLTWSQFSLLEIKRGLCRESLNGLG